MKHYKFIDRSKATKLLKDEKKVAPELKYRIVKQTESLCNFKLGVRQHFC